MTFNPFSEKPLSLEKCFSSWKEIYPKAYDKNEVDPYTKCRIILMNGTEYEQVWHTHQASRTCCDNNIRRDLAVIRTSEQMQQKRIAYLKPIDETVLETTIGYEQLAVDLTAALAKKEKDRYVREALNFALLEDFDHLYRYSDLLEMDAGIKAERLVGKYTEIMPARPTIAHHRHPADNVRRAINGKTADIATKLHTNIITAAEQQTMNYYMSLGATYTNDLGRRLYMEIGMVEEEHVTQYGSLIDTECTMLESCLMHEYTECYLYYSCYKTETDSNVKKIWELHLEQELAHLHMIANMLKKYEKKDWCEVIPGGEFPDLLELGSNIEYVRAVLDGSVNLTSVNEDYEKVCCLADNCNFFGYQNIINGKEKCVPSHEVICAYTEKNGKDYRFETSPNPIRELQDRTSDNTDVGRTKQCTCNNDCLCPSCRCK